LAKQKATKKEIETVISNIIREIEFLGRKTYEITTTFGLYLDWKKDKNKFNKFIENEVSKAKEKLNEENKSGLGESK
jgi:hypothetical protein